MGNRHVGFLGNPKIHPNCQIRVALAGTLRILTQDNVSQSPGLFCDACGWQQKWHNSLCPIRVVKTSLPACARCYGKFNTLAAYSVLTNAKPQKWEGAHLLSILLFRLRNLLGSQIKDDNR